MKKSILMILAVFGFGTLVAQNTPPATSTPTNSRQTTTQQTTTKTTTTQQNPQVPADVSKRFGTEYPDMRSTWSMSGANYRAEYMDTQTRMGRAIVYDKMGNPVGKESEVATGQFPVTITEYYNTSFPNETYKVWSSEEQTGNRNYFVTRKSEIIWFDDKGNYTRKTPISSDIAR